jgi:hypothetical protein
LVLERELGEFAVTYEINAYGQDAQAMYRSLSALQSNVLDLCNEYGVQIMRLAYEGDPERPKIIPKAGGTRPRRLRTANPAKNVEEPSHQRFGVRALRDGLRSGNAMESRS